MKPGDSALNLKEKQRVSDAQRQQVLSLHRRHSLREVAEATGLPLGRSIAVCLHDGPVGADIAMKIRGCEQEGKELILNVMAKLCRPGGELREIWNKRVAAEDVEQLNSLD